MAINERLARWIAHVGVEARVMQHPDADAARDVAARSRVPARRLAKVVVLRDEAGAPLMVVVPADDHVDLRAVHRVTGRHGLRLATEQELRAWFPDCEPGAMPPVGHLYGMPMYVDDALADEPEIHFQAGNHHEIVRMDWEDFARVARPFTGGLLLHREPSVSGG